MKSRTKAILILLTALVLCAFAIQQWTGLVKCKPLNGVTEAQAKPTLALSGFMDGSFQQDEEAYLKQNCGFREPLTRLYNQILWTCFRYSKVVEDQRVVVTKDNWMFEPWTLEEYRQSRSYTYAKDSLEMAQILENEAQRLIQLQKALEPYDTRLFVALLPGKEQICSEHIPPAKYPHWEKKITAYGFYSKRFKELGINHVDFAEWFMQMKDTVSYPLFPQTGTHWTNLAAQHAADSLVRYMEWLADTNMVNIIIGDDFQRTLKPDADLESLLNLIWPVKKQPNRLAYAYTDFDTTAWRPRLLTIGDSFYWNILNFTPVWDVYDGIPYWYYFSTAYFNNDDLNVSMKVSDLDVLQEVIDADFVMLAYSTTSLYKMSNGFSEQLIRELTKEPRPEVPRPEVPCPEGSCPEVPRPEVPCPESKN